MTPAMIVVPSTLFDVASMSRMSQTSASVISFARIVRALEVAASAQVISTIVFTAAAWTSSSTCPASWIRASRFPDSWSIM